MVGLLIEQPYLFPSIGPMVMLFFESPTVLAVALNRVLGVRQPFWS